MYKPRKINIAPKILKMFEIRKISETTIQSPYIYINKINKKNLGKPKLSQNIVK
jgi:hypothetical protein